MILAGTGHRPDKLGGYSKAVFERLLALAANALDELDPELVISGMAQGWDQAIAMAAKLSGRPYDAYIPFEGQEAPWPDEAKIQYRMLLDGAEDIVICSPGGYSKHKMQIRNVRMVQDCSDVLALWNGTCGGTANCIAYAKNRMRPIHNYWPQWKTRHYEN